MLADDVGGDALFARGPGEEERERVPKEARESGGHAAADSTCGTRYIPRVPRKLGRQRFAERVLHGVDDAGAPERVVIWIERKPGALWAVGRAVNPQHRESDEPRQDDYLFEGYELEDALECANEGLEDDLRVSEQDGSNEKVLPFRREELLKPLERWFFRGRS